MIITDDFVYLHYPKSGGTFVSRALRRLYGVGAVDSNQHGNCLGIPHEHRSKPIVASFKHPLSRMVALYEFGHWRRRAEHNFRGFSLAELEQLYPHFPDLSFRQYAELWNEHWIPKVVEGLGFESLDHIGIETYDFVEFFSRDRDKTLRALSSTTGLTMSTHDLPELCDVHFLRTDRLNHELHRFLMSLGWRQGAVDFILDAPVVIREEPERKAVRAWQEYFSEELLSELLVKERYLVEAYHRLG